MGPLNLNIIMYMIIYSCPINSKNHRSEDGSIITLETEDKRLHYDGDTSRHSHFICSRCGKIIDLFRPAKTPDEISDKGLMVTSEKCVYYGKCNDCLDEEGIIEG